jgi:hypothetical protein
MINIPDINKKIASDFGDKADKVLKILTDSFNKADYLNHPRIIRCIIFLADKDIEKLNKHIQTAITDQRDVMFWAEYTNIDAGQKPKRIRDINKTFEYSETDVKE